MWKFGWKLMCLITDIICYQGDRERCLEVGMDDYIDKPINAKKFENLINWHVRNVGGQFPPQPTLPGSQTKNK